MVKKLKKDKKLGVSEEKHRYDLPLNKDAGTGFLLVLIALMTFLAAMALCGTLMLGRIAHQWESGLEGKVTIEIPAENGDGVLLSREQIKSLAVRTREAVVRLEKVNDAEIMSDEDIRALIKPWFGNEVLMSDIPLPGLISVQIADSLPETVESVRKAAAKISPALYVDTHESWLNDILRLTGALQLSAGFIAAVIGVTTVVAIAGAVRSRMEMHKADVELLHLMGASDLYITGQFQRHALILAVKGAAAGGVVALLALLVFALLQSGEDGAVVPIFHLSAQYFVALVLLPPLMALVAGYTARHTVLRALGQMP